MRLSTLTVRELLELQVSAIEELRSRGIVRTSNNPVGDYTEWLVSTALGLKLEGNSATGFDAISPEGVRVQIKGRRVTTKNKSKQLGAIRNLAANNFDELVAVIFNEHFDVIEAIAIPHFVIAEYNSYRPHINGHILHVRGELLEDSRIKCIRNELNAANNSVKVDGLQPQP